MMDTKITSKSDNCPVESPPPAPTKSDSKIGTLKIRTPVEINKEFEGTPNSEEFEGTPNSEEFEVTPNSVDSSDQLRAFSFADFLRPPDPYPSLPSVSQLKEPSSVPVVLTVSSAQVVKTKRKSKYPGFGETILFEKIKTPTKSSSSREFKVNLAQYQVTPRCPKPGFNHPQGIIPPAAIPKSFPASVTGSYPTPVLTRSNPNVSSVTSFPTPSSVSRSFLMPSKTIISYSIPASSSTSLHSPSSVITPASYTSSRPTKAVPNEAGSGTRINDPGFGETAISSHFQRNQLKKHSVSDTDARDISASWPKLKPTEVLTSASTSKSFTAGSSKSQMDKLVGESFSSGFKVILPESQDSPKLPESQTNPKQLNPGVEKEKHYKISKPTGFNLRRENSVNTPSSFSFPANSTGSQVNEKTNHKGFPSRLSSVPTELNFYRESSGVQSSNTRKKYRGFGESTSSQVIEKTRNKRNSSSDKTAKKLQISSIYELDKISKSREEDWNSSDWDSSLRQWIQSEPYDHIQKRKVQKTNRGFEKTNVQQAKIQKSRARKGIYRSGENTAGSSTDSTPEDFSSESIEKLDENENNNAQRNFEVQNGNFNYDDISTDTEDAGRENLLDGVVMTISGYEDPLRGRIVSKAVAMGAKYRPGWTNDCSHLVCGFIGTFKYLQAKGRGKIVLGTWIEDCYKSRKKVNWMEYILSEEKADTEPVDETSSSSDGLRFLAGMEVRVKENYMIKRLAGKTGLVSGMHSETVQVMIQGCDQLRFFSAELEHLLPERGNKAKYVVKGEEDNVMEVISVDGGKDIAVVRWDGHKGAVVKLSHLCRVYEDTIVAEN